MDIGVPASEVEVLFKILEDAYWRLKDLPDLSEDEDLEEKVDALITELDQFFA